MACMNTIIEQQHPCVEVRAGPNTDESSCACPCLPCHKGLVACFLRVQELGWAALLAADADEPVAQCLLVEAVFTQQGLIPVQHNL